MVIRNFYLIILSDANHFFARTSVYLQHLKPCCISLNFQGNNKTLMMWGWDKSTRRRWGPFNVHLQTRTTFISRESSRICSGCCSAAMWKAELKGEPWVGECHPSSGKWLLLLYREVSSYRGLVWHFWEHSSFKNGLLTFSRVPLLFMAN